MEIISSHSSMTLTTWLMTLHILSIATIESTASLTQENTSESDGKRCFATDLSHSSEEFGNRVRSNGDNNQIFHQ